MQEDQQGNTNDTFAFPLGVIINLQIHSCSANKRRRRPESNLRTGGRLLSVRCCVIAAEMLILSHHLQMLRLFLHFLEHTTFST